MSRKTAVTLELKVPFREPGGRWTKDSPSVAEQEEVRVALMKVIPGLIDIKGTSRRDPVRNVSYTLRLETEMSEGARLFFGRCDWLFAEEVRKAKQNGGHGREWVRPYVSVNMDSSAKAELLNAGRKSEYIINVDQVMSGYLFDAVMSSVAYHSPIKFRTTRIGHEFAKEAARGAFELFVAEYGECGGPLKMFERCGGLKRAQQIQTYDDVIDCIWYRAFTGTAWYERSLNYYGMGIMPKVFIKAVLRQIDTLGNTVRARRLAHWAVRTAICNLRRDVNTDPASRVFLMETLAKIKYKKLGRVSECADLVAREIAEDDRGLSRDKSWLTHPLSDHMARLALEENRKK